MEQGPVDFFMLVPMRGEKGQDGTLWWGLSTSTPFKADGTNCSWLFPIQPCRSSRALSKMNMGYAWVSSISTDWYEDSRVVWVHSMGHVCTDHEGLRYGFLEGGQMLRCG